MAAFDHTEPFTTRLPIVDHSAGDRSVRNAPLSPVVLCMEKPASPSLVAFTAGCQAAKNYGRVRRRRAGVLRWQKRASISSGPRGTYCSTLSGQRSHPPASIRWRTLSRETRLRRHAVLHLSGPPPRDAWAQFAHVKTVPARLNAHSPEENALSPHFPRAAPAWFPRMIEAWTGASAVTIR